MLTAGQANHPRGWIQQSGAAGGIVFCGSNRQGATLEATIMESVPRDQPLVVEEAFGPAVVLSKYTDYETALAEVNDSKFGLQAGIFTDDIHKAMRAWDVLEVGGVLIGEVPSFRVDNMPYGGVKDSWGGRG